MMALPSLWVASGEAPAQERFANVHYRRAFLLLRRKSELSWTRVIRDRVDSEAADGQPQQEVGIGVPCKGSVKIKAAIRSCGNSPVVVPECPEFTTELQHMPAERRRHRVRILQVSEVLQNTPGHLRE